MQSSDQGFHMKDLCRLSRGKPRVTFRVTVSPFILCTPMDSITQSLPRNRRWPSLCLAALLLLSAAEARSFELTGVSPPNAEVNEVITIATAFGTFNAGSTISITFFQGAIAVSTVSKLGVVPNVSIDVRVPTIPLGEYQIEVVIDAVTSDNQLTGFQVVGARPFQLVLLDHETGSGDAAGALPAGTTPSGSDYKDIEFGDIDNDGDLDIYSFNRKSGEAAQTRSRCRPQPGARLPEGPLELAPVALERRAIEVVRVAGSVVTERGHRSRYRSARVPRNDVADQHAGSAYRAAAADSRGVVPADGVAHHGLAGRDADA